MPGVSSCWKAGYALRTVNGAMSAANSLLEYCGHREFQVQDLPAPAADAQPELTRSEYIRLLQAAKMQGKARTYLLVKSLALLGLGIPAAAARDGRSRAAGADRDAAQAAALHPAVPAAGAAGLCGGAGHRVRAAVHHAGRDGAQALGGDRRGAGAWRRTRASRRRSATRGACGGFTRPPGTAFSRTSASCSTRPTTACSKTSSSRPAGPRLRKSHPQRMFT